MYPRIAKHKSSPRVSLATAFAVVRYWPVCNTTALKPTSVAPDRSTIAPVLNTSTSRRATGRNLKKPTHGSRARASRPLATRSLKGSESWRRIRASARGGLPKCRRDGRDAPQMETCPVRRRANPRWCPTRAASSQKTSNSSRPKKKVREDDRKIDCPAVERWPSRGMLSIGSFDPQL